MLRSHKEAGRIRAARRPKPEPPREARVPEAREIMPEPVADEVLARYAAGEPAGEIGRELGAPASRVYRLLTERGVLRSKSEARKVAHARRKATDPG